MPDHVHLILHPPEGIKLGILIGQLKGKSSREIIRVRDDVLTRTNGQPAIWQRRCYDHNCRTIEKVIEKINYCHMNPVKNGLVPIARDYIWSSCRWYEGYNDAIIEVDGINI